MALTIANTETGRIKVTGTTATNQAIYADYVGVKFVYWFKPSRGGHLCTLKDVNGVEIMEMNALADNDTQMWPVYKMVEGVYCDNMDSGTLYIYLR